MIWTCRLALLVSPTGANGLWSATQHSRELDGSRSQVAGSSLRKLTLSSNHHLCGPLPSSVGSMIELQELIVKTSSLSGSFPDAIGLMSSMILFDIRESKISGTLPESIGSMLKMTISHESWITSKAALFHIAVACLTRLRYLLLGNNTLSGCIPDHLGSLLELLALTLSTAELSRQDSSCDVVHEAALGDLSRRSTSCLGRFQMRWPQWCIFSVS